MLMKLEEIYEIVLCYFNCFFDYFFVVVWVVNVRSGIDDVEYERSVIVFWD